MAADHLIGRGWSILDRNYRFGRREVDLVMTRPGVLAFVEVKTRADSRWGDPLEAIDVWKRREIQAVAAHWLATHVLPGVDVRFDAVAVVRDATGVARVRHVADAWRP